ncbi:hypothetical protein D3C76_1344210 [compost metagenome]
MHCVAVGLDHATRAAVAGKLTELGPEVAAEYDWMTGLALVGGAADSIRSSAGEQAIQGTGVDERHVGEKHCQRLALGNGADTLDAGGDAMT